MDPNHDQHVAHAVGIVTAYIGRHHISATDVPGLLASVHAALVGLREPAEPAKPDFKLPTKRQIDASVRRDALVSFIDGKPYKTLKRHLTKNGFTPDTYRDCFGLPSGYPMAAAGYSERRSELAKQMRLGQRAPALHAVA